MSVCYRDHLWIVYLLPLHCNYIYCHFWYLRRYGHLDKIGREHITQYFHFLTSLFCNLKDEILPRKYYEHYFKNLQKDNCFFALWLLIFYLSREELSWRKVACAYLLLNDSSHIFENQYLIYEWLDLHTCEF